MDSRFHGNDNTDLVIPAKAGIQFLISNDIYNLENRIKATVHHYESMGSNPTPSLNPDTPS